MTDALYQALILEHAKHPHHRGDLPGATHAATVDNPLCGDIVTLQLVIDGDRIAAVAHDGHGCTLSIAAASMLADRLVGLEVAAARALVAAFEAMVVGDEPVSTELGELGAFVGVRAFRSRQGCATLPGRALVAALHQPHC